MDRHSCEQPFALADVLDEQISRFIETFRIENDRERREILRLSETRQQHAQPAATGPSPEQIKRQLERARELYELGDYTRDEYMRRKSQLTLQLTQARPAGNADRQRCIDLLLNFGDLWAGEDDPAERQQFIRFLFDRIIATDGRITEMVIREDRAPLFLSQAGFSTGSDGVRARILTAQRRRFVDGDRVLACHQLDLGQPDQIAADAEHCLGPDRLGLYRLPVLIDQRLERFCQESFIWASPSTAQAGIPALGRSRAPGRRSSTSL